MTGSGLITGSGFFFGQASFTVTADDGAGDLVLQNFTVEGPNTPPTWVTPAGSLGTFTALDTPEIELQATDPDAGQVLTYALSAGSLPSGWTLSSAGQITGQGGPFGTSSFTVTVSDSAGGNVPRSFSITGRTAPLEWIAAQGSGPVDLGNYPANASIGMRLAQYVSNPNPGAHLVFTVAAGAQPPGWTLAPDGTLTGAGSDFGSGSGRNKVVACRSIDANRLRREGCLQAGWLGGWR
jgi:hypothetical protein